MEKLSKNKIDSAGRIIAKGKIEDEIKYIESEDVFEQYRKSHLQPLSDATVEIQKMLQEYNTDYYIAQRLKRKPQIIRKLNRLSVRLTQLQDIGGCRIVVPTNKDVDTLLNFLKTKLDIQKTTDYREEGRDDTGYRAVHIILKKDGLLLELQIRSRIQHYWAESIERISVIYGYHLKEKEGDDIVINYFKQLSGAFYKIEMNQKLSTQQKLDLDESRVECENIIKQSDKYKVFDSFVNEDIIKSMIEKEKNNNQCLNNWILVFDWKTASFVLWDTVSLSPRDAIKSYIKREKEFPSDDGYEVVLVGSSNVEYIRKTHSHYFGIDSPSNILETLDQSIMGFSKNIDIDSGAIRILSAMYRHKLWGTKTVTSDTLSNHYCKDLLGFDNSLKSLFDKDLVQYRKNKDFSLNIKKKSTIESYF